MCSNQSLTVRTSYYSDESLFLLRRYIGSETRYIGSDTKQLTLLTVTKGLSINRRIPEEIKHVYFKGGQSM